MSDKDKKEADSGPDARFLFIQGRLAKLIDTVKGDKFSKVFQEPECMYVTNYFYF